MNNPMVVVHPYLTSYQRDLLIRLVDQERERLLNWQLPGDPDRLGDPSIEILNRIEEELKQAK